VAEVVFFLDFGGAFPRALFVARGPIFPRLWRGVARLVLGRRWGLGGRGGSGACGDEGDGRFTLLFSFL